MTSPRALTVLSPGWGVQSWTLAAVAAIGEISPCRKPPPWKPTHGRVYDLRIWEVSENTWFENRFGHRAQEAGLVSIEQCEAAYRDMPPAERPIAAAYAELVPATVLIELARAGGCKIG